MVEILLLLIALKLGAVTGGGLLFGAAVVAGYWFVSAVVSALRDAGRAFWQEARQFPRRTVLAIATLALVIVVPIRAGGGNAWDIGKVALGVAVIAILGYALDEREAS